MRRIAMVALVSALALGLMPPAIAAPSAASGLTATAVAAPSYLTSAYRARALPPELLPYAVSSPLPLEDRGPHDAAGVRMFVVNGVQHNHPVAQAQYGLWLLDSYRQSGDRAYLDRSIAQAQRLLSGRVQSNGAWFFPYDFGFALHQDATKGVMRAP